MFDIVAMRQGKQGGGVGAKVVGNEREGRAKGAPPAEVGWTGEGVGGGGTGERGTSGSAADGAAGLRLVRSVVSRRRRWRGEVVATGERGVGWVGARVDAGTSSRAADGAGAAGLRRRRRLSRPHSLARG
ncbi:hypothetical protein THAOC_01935, partial [Thalassiosira oceanica]